MKSKLKLLIVGPGGVAQNSYLPYLSKREDLEIWIHGRSAQKTAEVAEKFGVQILDDLGALKASGFDSVLVLTAETARNEVSLGLLEHDIGNIFFEKPLVADKGQDAVEEEDFFKGKTLLEKAAQKGTTSAMVFNYRYLDQSLLMKQLMRENRLGKLTQVSALTHYACWSHVLDLIQHWGGAVEELVALESREEHAWGEKRARDVTASFNCESGVSGSVVGTYGIDFSNSLFEIKWVFEKAQILFEGLDEGMEIQYVEGEREKPMPSTSERRWAQYGLTFERSLADYLEYIAGNQDEVPIPGKAGLLELRLEAAMRRSIATGSVVNLNETFSMEKS